MSTVTVRPSRTECRVAGRWLTRVTGGPGFDQLLLPPEGLSSLPGELERGGSGTSAWVTVDATTVERRIRYQVTTDRDGVPAEVIQVEDGRAELYNATGEGGAHSWPGNLHDGWSVWVPVGELGEVSVTRTELSPDGRW